MDGLRISTEVATFADTLVHLGSLQLFVGHHIHILRGRNIRRAPALITACFEYAKASKWKPLGVTKSTDSLGGRGRAPG